MALRLKFSKPCGRENERERFRALLQSEGYRRHRDGELSTADYTRFVTGTESNRVVDDVLSQCKDNKCALNGYAFSWDDIIAWIDAHWFEILKVILTVAILFLEPKPSEGEKDV
jgi:hypothetical protein